MKCIVSFLSLVIATVLLSQSVMAGVDGALATDRFGYTGSTTRYATLADALNETNAISTITIGNRDLSLFQVTNLPAFYTDSNVIMGAWFYTTDPGGAPGAGNMRGNRGIGYLQIYEIPGDGFGSLTPSTIEYRWGGHDGSVFTKFNFHVAGTNATGATSTARFSPFVLNIDDFGIYHEYDLRLRASGLDGMETSPGFWESSSHPTGVTGSYTGIFENTSSDPNKVGFYTFDLELDMVSWAWENRADLTYPTTGFADSYFATSQIPEPASAGFIGLALMGVAFARRRRP